MVVDSVEHSMKASKIHMSDGMDYKDTEMPGSVLTLGQVHKEVRLDGIALHML